MLHEFLMFSGEGGGKVAVDVEFANNFAVHKHRNDDFRFGFKRAGEIARIFGHVVDDNRLPAGSGRSANALVERDARVRRHRALKGSEHQHGRLAPGSSM